MFNWPCPVGPKGRYIFGNKPQQRSMVHTRRRGNACTEQTAVRILVNHHLCLIFSSLEHTFQLCTAHFARVVSSTLGADLIFRDITEMRVSRGDVSQHIDTAPPATKNNVIMIIRKTVSAWEWEAGVKKGGDKQIDKAQTNAIPDGPCNDQQ